MLNNDRSVEKLDRIGKRITVIILVGALIVIGIMLYKVFTLMPEVRDIPIWQKVKIEKYCKARKIRPGVIEIHWNGKMYYYLNNQKCEIKG